MRIIDTNVKYFSFVDDLKKKLSRQKLVSIVSRGNIARATDDDLKIYYNNNKNDFSIANKITVVQYSSKDKQALKDIKTNPMMINKNVTVTNIVFTQNSMQPQIKYIVNATKKKTFSAIFTANKTYNMFFITKKDNIDILSFEKTKDKIFNIVMRQREKEYLKNYFETLKITADIKILR
jgi:hypothetical protein